LILIFPALPDLLRSNGPATGSSQLRECNLELLGRKIAAQA
jgi:hypothetical protein